MPTKIEFFTYYVIMESEFRNLVKGIFEYNLYINEGYKLTYYSECLRIKIKVFNADYMSIDQVFLLNPDIYIILHGNIDFEINEKSIQVVIENDCIINKCIKCRHLTISRNEDIYEKLHLINAKIFHFDWAIKKDFIRKLHANNPDIFAYIRCLHLNNTDSKDDIDFYFSVMPNLVGFYSARVFNYWDKILFIVRYVDHDMKIIIINTNHCEYENLKFEKMQNCITNNGLQHNLFTGNGPINIKAPKLCLKILKNANKQ
jgi:hypothetical protein